MKSFLVLVTTLLVSIPIVVLQANRFDAPSEPNASESPRTNPACRFPDLHAGLFGSNSGTFFIPKGVPKPTGDPGHSTVYDFNTLSCSGTLCNLD
jgi:hypothetical protein